MFHNLAEAMSNDVTSPVTPLTPAGAWLTQGRPRAGTSPFPEVLSHCHGAVGQKLQNTTKNPNQTRTNQTNNNKKEINCKPFAPEGLPVSALSLRAPPAPPHPQMARPRPITDGHSRGHHGPPAVPSRPTG